MERITSPRWKQEFGNLDKDPGSRRAAMNALKNYVQQLDNKAIQQFLSHLSELRDGQMPKQYSISLYEVLAREHGKNIIPQINKIMCSVLKTLSSNAPSLALQQACAKVVSALARYTIDPSTFEGQREGILRDLSNPLLEVLLGKAGTLAEGAAMCLQALVESEAWKFAPEDVVNEVCLRVTGALEEKGTQTVSHMKLVCLLANSNSLILEAYGRSLLKAAGEILEVGAIDGNWQQRLYAVQMINCLLKSVDVGILASEIPHTIENLERCRTDRMPSVRNGVSETLQVAKAIASEMGMSSGNDSSCSEEEIPSGADKSPRSSLRGESSDFLNDTQMDSYIYSPDSSMQSLDTKYQTHLELGFDSRADRSHFHADQCPGLHSMDDVALSEKERDSSFSPLSLMDESMTPRVGQEVDATHASHPFSSHPVKCGECSGHMSMLLENGGSRSISLENGMVSGSDADLAAQYESDGGSGGNCLLGHLQKHGKAKSDNFDKHEDNGDALSCQKENYEWKPAYEEARNDEESQWNRFSFSLHCTPCLRPPYMEEEAFTPRKLGSQMTIDDASTFSTPRRLVRSLQKQFSPDFTSGEKQKQCTDNAGVNDEISSEADWRMNHNTVANHSDDNVTGEKHGQAAVALKGRILLENLDGVADECSDKSISQDGDLQESSSVWSRSVHRSESVSSASSSTLFVDTTDNQDLQSTALTEGDNGSRRINDGEDKCLLTDVESVEVSIVSLGLQETSAFCRGWTKAINVMESVLRGCLCAVLAVPAAMVAAKFFRMQEEYHVLVPT